MTLPEDKDTMCGKEDLCTENDRKDTFASRVRVILTGFLVGDIMGECRMTFSHFCVLRIINFYVMFNFTLTDEQIALFGTNNSLFHCTVL